MISIRVATACGLWLLPVAAITARRGVTPTYLAALSIAAAATAAVAADELTTRRGDQVTDSCLAALEVHDLTRPCQCRPPAAADGRTLRSVLAAADLAESAA